MNNSFYARYNYNKIIPFNLKKNILRVHSNLIGINAVQKFWIGDKIKFWYYYFAVSGLKKNNTLLKKDFLNKKLSVFFISNFNMIEGKWIFPKIYINYYEKYAYLKKKKFNLMKSGFILNNDYSNFFLYLFNLIKFSNIINKQIKYIHIFNLFYKYNICLKQIKYIHIKNNYNNYFFKYKKKFELPILFIKNIRQKRKLRSKKKYNKKIRGSYNVEGFLNKYKKRNILKTIINNMYLNKVKKIKKMSIKWKKARKINFVKKISNNKILKKINSKYIENYLYYKKKKQKNLKYLLKIKKIIDKKKKQKIKFFKNRLMWKYILWNKHNRRKKQKNKNQKQKNWKNNTNKNKAKIKENKKIHNNTNKNKAKIKENKKIDNNKINNKINNEQKNKMVFRIKNKIKFVPKLKWLPPKLWVSLNSYKSKRHWKIKKYIKKLLKLKKKKQKNINKYFLFKYNSLSKFFVIKKILGIIQLLKLMQSLKVYSKTNFCLWFYKHYINFKFFKFIKSIMFIKNKQKYKKVQNNIFKILEKETKKSIKQTNKQKKIILKNKWKLKILNLIKKDSNIKNWFKYLYNKLIKIKTLKKKYLLILLKFNKNIKNLYKNKLNTSLKLFKDNFFLLKKFNINYKLMNTIWWQYSNYSKIRRLKLIKHPQSNLKIKRRFNNKYWIKRNNKKILHWKNLRRLFIHQKKKKNYFFSMYNQFTFFEYIIFKLNFIKYFLNSNLLIYSFVFNIINNDNFNFFMNSKKTSKQEIVHKLNNYILNLQIKNTKNSINWVNIL